MGDVGTDAHPSVVFELFWHKSKFSIFDTAHLTDLGSKTAYRRLTSLKMSNNLLIHHAGS